MSYLRHLRTLHHAPRHGERRAEQQARALQRCRRGQHSMHNTLVAGEQLCTTCGLRTYCPLCIPAYRSQYPLSRAHAFLCAMHRRQEGGNQ